ncbi:MAG: L,D-transpeptidase [Gemmatimonadota bacterium]
MYRKTMTAAALALLASGAGFLAFNRALPASDVPAAGSNFSIKVDLSDRQLYVLRNGEVSGTYSVAVGAPGFPTPKGSYTVKRIVWNPRWVPPDSKWARDKIAREPGDPKNPMGKVKIFFREPDYYIHGTREVDSLGQAESHGCIRMRNSEVVALARLVMTQGGVGKPDSWFQRVVNRVRSTQSVRLAQPVSVQITA